MANDNKKPSVPMFVLRSVVRPLTRVIERHAKRGPQLAVPGGLLAQVAASYAAAYDTVQALNHANSALKEQSDESARDLEATTIAWASVTAPYMSGFDAQDWRPLRNTPDEVLRAAEQFREDAARAHATTPISGADEAIAELDRTIALTEEALAALKAGLADEQEQRAEVRKIGVELVLRLSSYRRVFARAVGPKHRDYQTLLVRRSPSTTTDSIELPAEESPSVASAEPIAPVIEIAPGSARMPTSSRAA